MGKKKIGREAQVDRFLRDVQSPSAGISSEQYLEMVRKRVVSSQNKMDLRQLRTNYFLEKLCEICQDFRHDEKLLLCDYCDDAFHTFCLTPALSRVPDEEEDWFCPPCMDQKSKLNNQKEGTVESKTRAGAKPQQSNGQFQKQCGKCKGSLGKRDYFENEKCVKCSKVFHSRCFNQKKQKSIVCESCITFIEREIPYTKKSMEDFFTRNTRISSQIQPSKIQIISAAPPPHLRCKGANKIGGDVIASEPRLKKQQRTSIETRSSSVSQTRTTVSILTSENSLDSSLQITKSASMIWKGGQFLLPQPSLDPEINLACNRSLIFALKSKNIEFCDDLWYSSSCMQSANSAEQEASLFQLDASNLNTFKSFKEMTRVGSYAPLLIEEDKEQGFIARAIEDIKAKTLIAEYAGEVAYARHHLFNDNDSIMDLLRTSRSSTSLVIIPERRANLARFISGINNNSRLSMAKQNVRSIRFNVQGEAHVLLYAKKNIKKGQLLYYDYNEGGFGEYPTAEFI